MHGFQRGFLSALQAGKHRSPVRNEESPSPLGNSVGVEEKRSEALKDGSNLWPVVSLLAVFLWTLVPIRDLDIWFYVEYGRRIFEDGAIPWSDSFLGTTDGLAFHRHGNHAWISYGICYLFYRAGGLPGLVALMSLLFVAIAWLTYLNCRLAGLSKPWASLLTLLGVWSVRSRFLLRSNLMGDVMLSLLIYVLLKERQKGDSTRFPFRSLALVFVAWTNTHQGVVVGLVLLAGWLLTRPYSWKTRIQALSLASLCCFVRPHGWWFPFFYIDHFGNTRAVSGVLEWLPMDPWSVLTHLGPLLLLGLIGISLSRSEFTQKWGDIVLAALFFALAIRSLRAVSEVLPVCVPLIASLWAYREPPKRWLIPASLGLAVAMALTWQGVEPSRLARLLPQFPDGLIRELPADHGQIFNSYEFGNYLIYRGKAPFVHGMTALFKEQLLVDFKDVLNRSSRREELLKTYKVTEMILHHPTAEDATELLVEDLYNSSEWKLDWWDDSGLLFRRQSNRDLKAVRPWNITTPWSDREAAKKQLDLMLTHRPSALALYLRGRLHNEDNEKESARRLFEQSLEINPESYQALFAHGALCFELGDLESAENSLVSAAKAAPNSPYLHFNLAVLYLRTGQNSKAKRELQRTLELDPGFQKAHEYLVQIP